MTTQFLNNHRIINGVISFAMVITLLSCTSGTDTIIDVSVVNKPGTIQKNKNYISNRAPLQPSALIKLPVTAIKPEGWLLEYLHRQRSGLTGNLGKISTWLQKENNAWFKKNDD